MKSITWDNIDDLSDPEISYLLYTEGKDIKTICKIRNISKSEIEKHIIECKVKYRIFEGSNNLDSIAKRLMRFSKEERINALNMMTQEDKKKIEKYAQERLFESNRDECMFYIWILGELASKGSVPSLITFLKCSDGNIKRICCSALGKIGDIKSEDALIQCLNESRLQIKDYAIRALGKLKSEKALDKLRIIAKSGEKEYIIRSAQNAIDQIEGKGGTDD
jgi:HEAT repeat protein